jgi:hypothetical protein
MVALVRDEDVDSFLSAVKDAYYKVGTAVVMKPVHTGRTVACRARRSGAWRKALALTCRVRPRPDLKERKIDR